MKQRISVLMPVYNTAPFLKEAIDSILSQTYRDFEFIIINDGSTDNTKAIIEGYKDDRIKFINNDKNLGIIKTRNLGLSLCQGEYIVCMDSDDISLPTRIEKQIQYLDAHPDVAVIASKLMMIDEEGKEKGYWDDDYINVTTEQIKTKLPLINCIGQPTVMMRSAVVKKLGGYNPSFMNNEDWGLWLSVISEGHKIDKLDEVLLKYRIHTTSSTAIAKKTGVGKKILRFKFHYLKERIKKLKWNETDKKVFVSFMMDFIKYNLPFIYSLLAKIRQTRPLEFYKQLKKIQKQFLNNQISHIFFFPSYNTGGADRVHAFILETVANQKPIVFITSVSSNDAMLDEFKKSAVVFDIAQLLLWPFTRNWLTKKIIYQCNINKNLVLFGSNSPFLYTVISAIPEHTKAIDLIHAFSHAHEDSPEKWSLPVVKKLSNRIVINKKTQQDLADQYKQENIEEQLINRVICISNFVAKHTYAQKTIDGKIKIMYVGRGSIEKRVHLIARTARLLAAKKSEVEFHFIGNVKYAIDPEDLEFCILHGEVTDQKILDDLYDEAHILVMASSREGFPMVIMEAMMKGVVPISTNVGGISEHINNNENGILINSAESGDIITEIASAIEHLLNNRAELNKMSKNAHTYALEHFDKNTFVESYKKVLTN